MTRHEEHYNTVTKTEVVTDEHKAEWTHELLGAVAGFSAMKTFNHQQEKNGKVVEHSTAKELLAALAGAAADNLIETKGLDWVDHHKFKKQAEEEAQKLYTEKTGYEF